MAPDHHGSAALAPPDDQSAVRSSPEVCVRVLLADDRGIVRRGFERFSKQNQG
jgi:hypothetical protein